MYVFTRKREHRVKSRAEEKLRKVNTITNRAVIERQDNVNWKGGNYRNGTRNKWIYRKELNGKTTKVKEGDQQVKVVTESPGKAYKKMKDKTCTGKG